MEALVWAPEKHLQRNPSEDGVLKLEYPDISGSILGIMRSGRNIAGKPVRHRMKSFDQDKNGSWNNYECYGRKT